MLIYVHLIASYFLLMSKATAVCCKGQNDLLKPLLKQMLCKAVCVKCKCLNPCWYERSLILLVSNMFSSLISGTLLVLILNHHNIYKRFCG